MNQPSASLIFEYATYSNKVVIANVVYLLYSYNIIQIGGVLLTDVFTFEMP